MLARTKQILAAVALTMACRPGVAQDERQVTPLVLGVPQVESLGAEQQHEYRISLAEGQFVAIVVEQRGVDVVVALEDGRADRVAQVNAPNGAYGPETLLWVAKTSEEYSLTVRSWVPKAPPGSYSVRIEQLRAATLQDRRRVATQLFKQAMEVPIETQAIHADLLSRMRSTSDRQGEISVLKSLAGLYSILGRDNSRALQYWAEVLDLQQVTGDRFGQAMTLKAMASVYDSMGQRQQGMELKQRAIGIINTGLFPVSSVFDYWSPRGLDRHFNITLDQARRAISDALCSLYNQIGEFRGALEHCARELTIQERLDEFFPANPTTTDLITKLARIYQKLGEPNKSLELYDRALARSSIYSPQDLAVLEEAGDFYSSLGHHEEAFRAYERATSDPASGPEVFDSAIRASRAARAGSVMCKIAREQAYLGHLFEARHQYEVALALTESRRLDTAREDQPLEPSVRQCYEGYVDLLMHGRTASARGAIDFATFSLSEKARARGFLGVLAFAASDYLKNMDPELVARWQTLRSQVETVGADKQRPVVLAGDSAALGGNSNGEELEALEHEIRVKSPAWANVTVDDSSDAVAIQSQIDNGTLLLEYMLGSNHSYLWAVARESIRSVALPSRGIIETAARKLYGCISAHGMRETSDCRDAARTLSKMVLMPIGELPRFKRVLIVAEGALQFVPFGLLPTSMEGSPMIASHEVVNLPSASALLVLRHKLEPRAPAPRSVAIFADPVFSVDDPRLTSPHRSRITALDSSFSETESLMRSAREVGLDSSGKSSALPRLPFTRVEATAIRSLDRTLLEAVDFAANIDSALDSKLSDYRIIHFATHGLMNSAHPELSGLALSLVDEQGQPRNGFLRLHDIFGMRLNADLVVLSACQTALGAEISGEGLVGLTRAFMYAGAPRVVASLWSVDDAAAAELMRRFYLGLLVKHLRPAAALRLAQNEMRSRPQWRSPYYWAGFIIQGEWR